MSGIERLTEAEQFDLAERIHECVVKFKRLRSSSFWNVQTFRVSDIATELSTKQAVWLAGWIAIQTGFRVNTEEDVLKMPIELPDGLSAGAGQMYALSVDFNWLEKLKDDDSLSELPRVSLNVMKLKFVVVGHADMKARA